MTRTAPSAMLTAPTLPQANRYGINALAAAQLQVDIAPYPGMEEGDLIELFWNNCFADSRRVSACKIGTPTRLRIPHSFVQDGSAQIHYQVMQIGHGPARSAVTHVRVKTCPPGGQPSPRFSDENQNLAPVSLPDMIRRYGINGSPGATRHSAEHRAVRAYDHWRRHYPALGRRASGPADDPAQGRRSDSAGVGALCGDCRSGRRLPAGRDVLHSGSRWQ